MAEYINRDKALELAKSAGFDHVNHITWRGSYNKCTVPEKFEIDCVVRLCNAAIAHYIEQSVSELTGTDYKMPKETEMTNITIPRETVQQAYDALELYHHEPEVSEALDALRMALEAAQEQK